MGPQLERTKVDELAVMFVRDYRINSRKSLTDAETRWNQHLKPFFGGMRAIDVTSEQLARYVDKRQQEEAANATINRELAALKRMFANLGSKRLRRRWFERRNSPNWRRTIFARGFWKMGSIAN